ncbi:PCMD domain-containing protein [Elizabethkingia sp. JS20170427COW]|uniref:PCMD domain-containing protein n=1 Tax=Elizabethkingia sp. JS20170427COW TaxID=2583851 RepID=UPI001110B578|nr:PCMD domain-containing protein [Elizabethkingia sp. JS20170427COW]QCX53286.1 hypothetical protein FGE20_05835 [Elizabethkingia sp. JS20170427COW]
MKNSKFILLLLMITGLSLISCIRDEAPNMEADIEVATIANASELLQVEPTITENTITFRLKDFQGSMVFAPEFKLTPGAVISPASGTELDFSTPKTYTVTSEDGAWKKEYTVSFILDNTTDNYYHFSFENANTIDTSSPEGHYHEFFDIINGQTRKDWSSGNEGYNILAATLVKPGESLTPAFYPTAQTPNGYFGKGVKMQTKETGPLGAIFGSALAAGNLYVGTFQFSMPAIKSTHFGQPYTLKDAPKAIVGYFKYKAGSEFKNNSGTSKLTKDTWDAYAIVFEKSTVDNYLPGDHNFKDGRMVSVARIDEAQRIETDKWTRFEIPFKSVNGKTFDPKKEYMYTIVFSSSIEGDIFNGAVGSTLEVDEVSLITE